MTADLMSPVGLEETGAPVHRSRRERVTDALLTAGAVAGVVCVLVAIAAFALNVHLVIFRSGSMAPAVETGALGISRTVGAADLRVGDVVTVQREDGQRVTHRVREVQHLPGTAVLTLRGDANRVDDATSYTVSEADRLIVDIPRVGYAVAWLSGPLGMFGGGLVVGLVALVAFGRTPESAPLPALGLAPVAPAAPPAPPRPRPAVVVAPVVEERRPAPSPTVRPRRRFRTRPALAILVTMAVLALAALGAGRAEDTQASWNNAGTATSGTLASGLYAVPAAPRVTACTVANGNNGNTITWTATANPGSFEVRYTGSAFPSQSIAGTARSVVLAQGLNNASGSFYLVAINGNAVSASSNTVSYSGQGGGKNCTVN